MRVAIVYDRVTKWGGAERVLLALHKLYPEAPLYTAVYDKKRAAWADVFDVTTSFLQHIPMARTMHELFPWITPMAFETFSFDGYDLVISVTSAEAKSIITKPDTIHICYCLTPTRYLWSGYDTYIKDPGLGWMSGMASYWLSRLVRTLRSWDRVAASRPDYYIAISKRVKERIATYYHRDTTAVIYPPVDTKMFDIKPKIASKEAPYFLTVSRLVGYKHVDVIIKAFNQTGQRLIIIGDGYQKNYLKKLAKKNIVFIDHHLTDLELVRYHLGCRAFVYAADEDFGIAVVEAQASGKPVIAYRESAVSETVIDGKTGLFFDAQTPQAIVEALREFETKKFDPNAAKRAAARFDTEEFEKQIQQFVTNVLIK